EKDVVLVGHRLDVAGVHLARGSEKPVPVERRPRRYRGAGRPVAVAERGAWDVADEVRRVAGRVLDRLPRAVERERAARLAVGEQVAGHGEGAFDTSGDLVAFGRRRVRQQVAVDAGEERLQLR